MKLEVSFLLCLNLKVIYKHIKMMSYLLEITIQNLDLVFFILKEMFFV